MSTLHHWFYINYEEFKDNKALDDVGESAGFILTMRNLK